MLHTLFGSQWFSIFDSDLAVNYITFGSDHQILVGNPMVAMTSPLHRAAESILLHFCQLLSNPSIDLELEYIFGKPMKCRFQRYTVRTEILSTSHAQVEYISVTKYAFETTGPMGQTTPKSTPSPWDTWTLFRTSMPGPTPLTTPNDTSIGLHTSTQLRNKVPIGYSGMPKLHPKTTLPLRR